MKRGAPSFYALRASGCRVDGYTGSARVGGEKGRSPPQALCGQAAVAWTDQQMRPGLAEKRGRSPPGKVSEGATPPADWEKASEGGKAPFRLESYPAASPPGRVVFRRRRTTFRTNSPAGSEATRRICRRPQTAFPRLNSKKWPEGHFFDSRQGIISSLPRSGRTEPASP